MPDAAVNDSVPTAGAIKVFASGEIQVRTLKWLFSNIPK